MYHYIYLTHMKKRKKSRYVHFKNDAFEALEYINQHHFKIEHTLTDNTGAVTGFVTTKEREEEE